MRVRTFRRHIQLHKDRIPRHRHPRMSVSWNAVFMQLYVSAKRPYSVVIKTRKPPLRFGNKNTLSSIHTHCVRFSQTCWSVKPNTCIFNRSQHISACKCLWDVQNNSPNRWLIHIKTYNIYNKIYHFWFEFIRNGCSCTYVCFMFFIYHYGE